MSEKLRFATDTEWALNVRASRAEAEVERLRSALEFYADEGNYEWREVAAEESPDWTDEDRENAHSSSVLLDSGQRAREALRDG